MDLRRHNRPLCATYLLKFSGLSFITAAPSSFAAAPNAAVIPSSPATSALSAASFRWATVSDEELDAEVSWL